MHIEEKFTKASVTYRWLKGLKKHWRTILFAKKIIADKVYNKR